MKKRNRRLRGFTIIEFLTVASTLCLLLAVLMPAIQSAQEQARQTQCQKNLKEIGIAIHVYHDTHQRFPPGWVLAYRDPSSHPGHGWQSALLPFLQQNNVYQSIDRNVAPEAPNKINTLALEVFQCPTSSAPDQNPVRGGYGNSNYSGSFGSLPIPRWTAGRMESWWPGGVETFDVSTFQSPFTNPLSKEEVEAVFKNSRSRRAVTPTGLFRWNSNMRMRAITDGVSNTIAVGERSVQSGSGIWMGVQSNRYENDAVTDASHWSPINASFTGFSSEHGAGAFFLTVDASVRFLSQSVDSRPDRGVFQNLADVSDGEIVPPGIWSR